MSVGILLMTHPGIGPAMLNTTRRIMGEGELSIRNIEVPPDADMARTLHKTSELIAQLDEGDGVLILTDVFGATPNNIAREFAQTDQVKVLAGLSLPMLMRIFNYPKADLSSLQQYAIEGAERGINAGQQSTEDSHA